MNTRDGSSGSSPLHPNGHPNGQSHRPSVQRVGWAGEEWLSLRSLNPSRPGCENCEHIDQLFVGLVSAAGEDNEDGMLVGVVAAKSNHGATTTATNLAIRAGDHLASPTLLVDANPSHASISSRYGRSASGLAECLSGQQPIEHCIGLIPNTSTRVLGVGKHRSLNWGKTHTDDITHFAKLVRNEFSFTVIDLPLLGNDGPPHPLMEYLDGVILVSQYGVAKTELKRIKRCIIAQRCSLLGIVMTGRESILPRWLGRFWQ